MKSQLATHLLYAVLLGMAFAAGRCSGFKEAQWSFESRGIVLPPVSPRELPYWTISVAECPVEPYPSEIRELRGEKHYVVWEWPPKDFLGDPIPIYEHRRRSDPATREGSPSR